MFKKILVPLDGSALASGVLPHVRAIACSMRSEVILLRAVPEQGRNVNGLGAAVLDIQLASRVSDLAPSAAQRAEAFAAAQFTSPDVVERQAEADAFLGAIAAELERSGIRARTHVVVAAPAEAILDLALAEGSDLIAMSTHGRSGIGRFLLGSVADRVVRHAHAPVLLVRSANDANQTPQESAIYKRILVPLDGSELAGAVLPFAIAIARCTDAQVTLLQAVPEPEMEGAEAQAIFALRGLAPDESMRRRDSRAQQLEYATEAAQSNLNAALPAFRKSSIRAETVVQVGRPAETILDVASTRGADLIAMSTHGRSGIGRFLMGSVADRVVRHAHAPVLLVRAGGAS